MTASQVLYERVRRICLALPDAVETMTWGKPHYRVANKIFAGCGEEGGCFKVGFKLELPRAHALVTIDPRFSPAPYVGRHGWVSCDLSQKPNWRQLTELIAESYRLIAPKPKRAKLAGIKATVRSPRKRSGKRTTRKGKGRTSKVSGTKPVA